MPRLLLFAPCQLASIDSATNNLSLINVIEAVTVPSFPAGLQELALVTSWRRYEEEAEASMAQRVVFFGPDKERVVTLETPFIFEKLGNRIVNRIANLPLKGPGQYEFCVFVKRQGAEYPEKPDSCYPLLVQQAPSVHVG